ncbi:PepSY domain-containing protein [Lederbergia lenta]|uniref:Peptidase propeptide and ypeb domain protein n=1 Tax=Lederbergia lenta TaxID=1467 RepID=A0A2X4VTT9_LEDLE|nr:PepSY domain-containing protein [Lederbergia lenta]MCM3110813.1 PepSY domain-containing protein [Lederbergia lenta]MEC2325792.1 PepSY domain-containing protein [Lederbergia lenta]SQI53739.1 peptidase propeptide and ypeb domain protein [Lederbergia lenta]
MHRNHWYNQNQYWHNPGYYQQPINWQRRVTIQEAMDIAVERVPGQIVKVELDTKMGTLIYEVDIVTAQGVKYEVEVDVNTGGILSVELD